MVEAYFIKNIENIPEGVFIKKSINDDSVYMGRKNIVSEKKPVSELYRRQQKPVPVKCFGLRKVTEGSLISRSKTMPCRNVIQNGICYRKNCSYADSIEELSPFLCSFGERCYRKNFVQKEKKCNYRHDESISEWSYRIGLDITGLPEKKQENPINVVVNTKVSLLYTKICKSLYENIPCELTSCTYAHSMSELKDPICSYGNRCYRRPGCILRTEQTECTFLHIGLETSDEYKLRIGFVVPSYEMSLSDIPRIVEEKTTIGFVKPVLYRTKKCNKESQCVNLECTYAHCLEQLKDPMCIYKDRCINTSCKYRHSSEESSIYRERIGFVNPFTTHIFEAFPSEEIVVIL